MGRLLIIGYRQGLIDTLQRQSRSFVVWTDSPLKQKQPDFPLFTWGYPRSSQDWQECLKQLERFGPIDHVLGVTERGVPIAAGLRYRWGGTREDLRLSLRCHDKWLMKNFLRARSIPMTPFLRHRPDHTAPGLMAALGQPVVCKDRCESGGRSVQFCSDAAMLAQAMHSKRLYERFIDAPEYSIESFIDRGRICFQNVTQYVQKRHINLLPAPLSIELSHGLLELNAKILQDLGLRHGMCHLEFYLTAEGPLFGELAIRPPGGYIMDLLELAYGFSAWEAYLATSLGEGFCFPQHAMAFAAAHVLHPGAGSIQHIQGWQDLQSMSSVVRHKLKIKVGSQLEERLGAGQDIGYILQRAPDLAELQSELRRIQGEIQFTLLAR